jgi:hypothetical protein
MLLVREGWAMGMCDSMHIGCFRGDEPYEDPALVEHCGREYVYMTKDELRVHINRGNRDKHALMHCLSERVKVMGDDIHLVKRDKVMVRLCGGVEEELVAA